MGGFDVLCLYSFLLARLQDDAGLLGVLREGLGTADATAEVIAAKALDRVNMMRAFDLVGVMEAVGEVRDELEGRQVRMEKESTEGPLDDPQPAGLSSDLPPEKGVEESDKELPKRTFVADSDDEGEEMLFDDEPAVSDLTAHPTIEVLQAEEQDEILFVDGPADQHDDNLLPPPADPQSQVQPSKSEQPQPKPPPPTLKPTFLLIDNLAHVITPLLKKDYAQGNLYTPRPHLPLPQNANKKSSKIANHLLPPHPLPPYPQPQPPHSPFKPQHPTPSTTQKEESEYKPEPRDQTTHTAATAAVDIRIK